MVAGWSKIYGRYKKQPTTFQVRFYPNLFQVRLKPKTNVPSSPHFKSRRVIFSLYTVSIPAPIPIQGFISGYIQMSIPDYTPSCYLTFFPTCHVIICSYESRQSPVDLKFLIVRYYIHYPYPRLFSSSYLILIPGELFNAQSLFLIELLSLIYTSNSILASITCKNFVCSLLLQCLNT